MKRTTLAIFECGCPRLGEPRWCEWHGLPYPGDPFRTEDADPVFLIEAEWREPDDVGGRVSLVAFVVALCGLGAFVGWLWGQVQ